MFNNLSQLAGLIMNPARLREEAEKHRQKLGQLTAAGDAGAGMVTVTINGRMEVLRCALSDEAMKLNDREMLEDLIRAATNQAIDKARQLVQEEMGKMASGLGLQLPPGVGLPGLE
jgi:DNA-binding YbaB/EbfC family protein